MEHAPYGSRHMHNRNRPNCSMLSEVRMMGSCKWWCKDKDTAYHLKVPAVRIRDLLCGAEKAGTGLLSCSLGVFTNLINPEAW